MFKNILKGGYKLALSTLKLDPVKFAIYEVARLSVLVGLKMIKNSPKNTLHEDIVEPFIKHLERKGK
jgi:hypothetical protein